MSAAPEQLGRARNVLSELVGPVSLWVEWTVCFMGRQQASGPGGMGGSKAEGKRARREWGKKREAGEEEHAPLLTTGATCLPSRVCTSACLVCSRTGASSKQWPALSTGWPPVRGRKVDSSATGLRETGRSSGGNS